MFKGYQDEDVENMDFEKIFQCIPNHVKEVFWIRENGCLIYLSPELERAIGKTLKDVNNSEPQQVVYPDDREYVRNKLLQDRKGKDIDIEFRIVGDNGAIRWIWIRTFTMDNNEEKTAKRIGLAVDITNRENANQFNQRVKQDAMAHYLMHLDYIDTITGLYNRNYFEKNIMLIDNEENLPLSVIIGDVNGLGKMNETLGYFETNKILKKIADLLKRVCSSTDLIIRYGGDEFIVILKNTEMADVRELCRQIKKGCQFISNLGTISLSLGYACKTSTDQYIKDIIRKAEERMARKKFFEVDSERSTIISFLQTILFEKDQETQSHTRRLQDIIRLLGEKMELCESRIDQLCLLAVLHDIGKIAIPENILMKPTALTESEWQIMKSHPNCGFRIANTIPEFSCISKEILTHHERWDGKGYPLGLTKEEIPLLARIISVVDAYDVMINGRVYKEAISKEEAINELIRNSGTQFDPNIVQQFVKVIDKI